MLDIEVSVDDGTELDKKSVEILDEVGFVGTFYVPIQSWGFDNLEVYKNHRVGHHTYSHPQDLKLLSTQDRLLEMGLPNTKLQRLENYSKTFCPPRGRYDEGIVRMAEQLELTQLRTTRVLCTKKSENIIQHTTIHVYDRKEYNGKTWFNKAYEVLKLQKPEYFHLWWHSWEIEKNGDWIELVKLLHILKEHENQHCMGE